MRSNVLFVVTVILATTLVLGCIGGGDGDDQQPPNNGSNGNGNGGIQTCSDNTPYGGCSTTKPEFCDSGNLIDKCSSCGCPTNEICQDNTCIELVCIEDSTKACKTGDYCDGTRTCTNNDWGSCVKDNPYCPVGGCVKDSVKDCTTTDNCSGTSVCSAGEWQACVKNDPNCPQQEPPQPTFKEPESLDWEPIGDWWDEILSICVDKWGISDPYFIAGIVKIESWFDPDTYNAAERTAYENNEDTWHGEYYGKGLTQITGPWIAGTPSPSTFEWQYNMPSEADYNDAPILTDAYNGQQNLDRGCWYFKALYDHYDGNQYKISTAYRFGFQDVDSASKDPYDNYYSDDVLTYKAEYLENVGYTTNDFPNE